MAISVCSQVAGTMYTIMPGSTSMTRHSMFMSVQYSIQNSTFTYIKSIRRNCQNRGTTRFVHIIMTGNHKRTNTYSSYVAHFEEKERGCLQLGTKCLYCSDALQ